MATVDEVARPKIGPRKVIERPRLFRLLDDSNARLRLLIGAAGYGKTTLAEQWVGRGGRRGAWVRCRRSASDIAVISRLMAAAGATVVPGCDRRFEQRLSVTPDPSREADVLAEILAEDLASWPAEAWMVIDDYHYVTEAAAAERFVEVVASESPVQLLIASRTRPGWVSSRDLVYQNATEIQQAVLAMTDDEADVALAGAGRAERAKIIEVASGWPAVVGLADFARSSTGAEPAIPEELFGFFEEEVLPSIDPSFRHILVTLAFLPQADEALLMRVFGESHTAALHTGLTTGLLDVRDGALELHPLAASFFVARGLDRSRSDVRPVIRAALESYMDAGEWDAAFELLSRYGAKEDILWLLETSLDALINSARLATLERWLTSSGVAIRESVNGVIARSEIAMRRGRHRAAQTLAERALGSVPTGSQTQVRALLVAGRAAHAGSRESEALRHFKQARELASSRTDQLVALHGLVMSAAALESPDARGYLQQLADTTNRSDPHQLLRLVDRQLSLGLRFGCLADLSESLAVSELLTEVQDPLARCSFRSMLSCSLALGAHYDEALKQAVALCQDASEYRLMLAFPYGFATAAVATAGLRKFDRAHAFLDAAAVASRECHDQYGLQNVFAIRSRVLIQQGRTADACALEPPDVADAIPSMRGEVIASRGLALACVGRLESARAQAELAASCTEAIEATVLARAIEAIVALRSRDSSVLAALRSLVTASFASGAVDLLVTAYRGCPDLLSSMLSYQQTREQAIHLLTRANDHELASFDGARPSERLQPLGSLTPREREVCDLAAHGLSNLEIARNLFITEATVKAHLHKIYDKVGVHSKSALATLVIQTRRE